MRRLKNPLSDLPTGEKVVVGVVGIAAISIVGYLLLSSQTAAASPVAPTLPTVPGTTPTSPTNPSGVDWSGIAGQTSPYVANGNATTYTGQGNSASQLPVTQPTVPATTPTSPLTSNTTSLLTPAQIAANPGINPATNLPWGETTSQVQAAYVATHPGSYVNAQGLLVDPTAPQPG